jgi:two-component system NtrC family sensor kinase
MKWFAIIVVSILSISQTKGQTKYIDSLKHELATAKEDSNKVKLYNALGYQYFFNLPDTAILYGQRALQLSEKIKFKRGEASSYFTLWVPMFTKGEYIKALDYGYKELHLYEELKDEKNIAGSHMSLANIYREQGDLRRALEHTFIMKNSFEKLGMNDPATLVNVHGNLATIYEQDNQLDSAILHGQKAIDNAKLANFQPTDNYVAYIRETIGHAYLKKKNYSKAMEYFKEVLPVYIANHDVKEILSTNYGIAASFAGMNNIDSALWYARKTYKERQHSGFIKNLQTITALLATIYKQKGMIDSSAIYMEQSMNLKDSLYSQAKEREIQNLVFEEQQREQQLLEARANYKRQLLTYGIIAAFIIALIFTSILWRNNKQKQKANILLQQQKEKVENALAELQTTQAQLIQSEKMASLGELTAGIAHEIQNPLNFVNNFSEVNKEMVDELQAELKSGNVDEAIAISNDIKENEEKINHHGKRADAIVKGMLQHSRKSSGVKELTDINALCDEYLRLSFHGLRAKDKSFNADFKTDFDSSLEKINIVPQDIGRVLLNLINNAFYAVNEKKKNVEDSSYVPTVTIVTKKLNDAIKIIVQDTGNGIPQNIIDKIFQPFFTTKPTGEGTGLGLSLAYDIITKEHNGTIKVNSKENEGSEFIITFPVT